MSAQDRTTRSQPAPMSAMTPGLRKPSAMPKRGSRPPGFGVCSGSGVMGGLGVLVAFGVGDCGGGVIVLVGAGAAGGGLVDAAVWVGPGGADWQALVSSISARAS